MVRAKGFKHSEETKRKIGVANSRIKRSEEQKKFLSEFWKGKRTGESNPSKRPEVREKLRMAWIRRRERGWIHPSKGKPIPDYVKIAISKKNNGEGNGNWKGDKVGHRSIHGWVRRRKKKPEFCEFCGKNRPYDLANISNEYKRDLNDYKYLCRSCHRKYDSDFKKNSAKFIKGINII